MGIRGINLVIIIFMTCDSLVSSGFDSYTAVVWDVILLTEVTEQLTCVLNSLLQPLCFADVWPWASQCTIVPSWYVVKGVDCALGQLCPGGRSSPLLRIKGSSHTCFTNSPFPCSIPVGLLCQVKQNAAFVGLCYHLHNKLLFT